ncbi:hypothetical protein PFISCL1PPCAC_19007, partial [Pristionchus fissidentatus]
LLSLFAICSGKVERIPKEEWSDMREVTSHYEIADFIGNELKKNYPNLVHEDQMIHFKKEMFEYLIADDEEQNELMAGLPTQWILVQSAMRKLKIILKKAFNQLSQDDKEYMKNESMFVIYKMILKPMAKLVRMNRESYKKRGLSKKELKL